MRPKTLLFLLLLLICGLEGFAQQFNFRNYSVGDGLAQSQVFCMLEDSRGYIWMGTRGGGISRFDGTSFTTYTTHHGLAHNYILSLYEDRNGHLWIGTNDGVSRFNGHHFVNYLNEEQEPLSVGSFAQDAAGLLWLGSSAGVLRFDGSEFSNLTETEAYPTGNTGFVFADRDSSIWIGHNRGLSKVTDNGLKTWNRSDGLRNHILGAVAEDKTGNLWIACYGNGINIYDGKQLHSLPNSIGLGNGRILDLQCDSAGNMWMATQDMGVLLWSAADSSVTQLSEQDGLCNNHVRTILEDSWGNLWFGSSGGGVSKYTGQQFVHYDKSNGLPGNYVYSVFEDSKGRLWAGTSDLGVCRRDSSGWVRFGADSGFTDEKVKLIFEDRDCNIWFGTEGQGIARYNDTSFVFYSGTNGLSNNWIRDIDQDDYGNIFVATSGGGITKMTRNDTVARGYTFQYFTTSNFNLPQTRVNCLHRDSWNRLWFGTPAKGIGYITSHNELVVFNEANGFPNNVVRSMREDDSGYLWIGTGGQGVVRAAIYPDSIRFDAFTQESGLASNNIYLLELDDEQNLWAGSETGIDKITLDADRNIIEVKHFGAPEGFVGIEVAQNAVDRDRQGNLWFGTINGLTMYKPGTREQNAKAPITSISEISLFYEPLTKTEYNNWVLDWSRLRAGLELPYNQNHLSFDFHGIDHNNQSKVRYQWRLLGAEAEWSPVSAKSDATYSNLAPGQYTFQVRAMNEDGVWNEKPVELSFAIAPPYWQTWWFIALLSLLGIGIIALIFRIRVAQLRREQKALTLEKDLVQLEQKALRLQMNPHFIFNALNSIQALITLKDEKTARYYLAKFSKLMRAILENSREPQISLEQEIVTLDSYLSLEQFSRDGAFGFSIEVEDDLDSESIVIPPMMLQPFVENAIIHGVAHLTDRKGQIDVRFRQNGAGLECTITDNGVGRKRAASMSSQIAHGHKSTALKVTQERLDLLNEKGGAKQSLKIEDLPNDGGTRVTVQLPEL